MSKGKIKRVNQKDLKYKKIKLLTKCMLDPNMNSSIIEEDKSEFNKSLKYRMFNHILIYPRILKYINEHLNNLYMFNKYSPKDWIRTFAIILRASNISKLYYPKFKVSQRDNFFKTTKEYFKITESNNRELNLRELNCIYELYNNRIISNDAMNQIKNISVGKETVTAKNRFDIPEPTVEVKPEKEKITEFIKDTRKYIEERSPCRQCKLRGEKNLIVRTNVNSPKEVDLAIISFSINSDEVKAGEIFGDHRGKVFHDLILDVCKDLDLTYVYTNSLLCQVPLGEKASNLKTEMKVCKDVNSMIIKAFTPKYKIILGEDARRAYGITTPLAKCHRRLMEKNCIVINSPDEVGANKKKFEKFKDSLLFIGELMKENKTVSNIKAVNIPENQKMERLEKGWVLLDTQVLGDGDVFYTFTHHETMQKKYVKKGMEFPIYIKNGNFKDCDYITPEVDDVIYVNAQEKAELSKQLGWNVRSILKNV